MEVHMKTSVRSHGEDARSGFFRIVFCLAGAAQPNTPFVDTRATLTIAPDVILPVWELAGSCMSVFVLNGSTPTRAIRAYSESDVYEVSLLQNGVRFAAGQKGHLPLSIRANEDLVNPKSRQLSFRVHIDFESTEDSTGKSVQQHCGGLCSTNLCIDIVLYERSFGGPFRFTFVDFDDSVQYGAFLQPGYF